MATEGTAAVVFDLGGVLIDWDPRHLYRKLFADENEMERFLSEVCTPEWHAQHDLGRHVAETIPPLLAAHPEFDREIRAYGERFPEMWSGANEDVVALVKDLQSRGCRTYAATNWSDEFWLPALADFEFLSSFLGVLVSGEIRVAKPDPAFFALLIEKFELDPQRTLYIDDNAANIEAAQRFGFVTHHFRTAAGLAEALSHFPLS